MADAADIGLDRAAMRARRHSRVTPAVCALLAATCLTVPSAALAQDNPLRPPASMELSEGDPMLLQADEMIYDNRNERVLARGNVEIYYGNYTLLADRVTYNRAAHTLEAEGNVRIRQPDGAIITADRIALTDDFRDGFIRSLRLVTEDDVRIGAAQAVREDGQTTTFDQAVFTPCRPCLENPEAPPTWQIRSTRVIHDEGDATITYENAYFDLFGYPVAWFPWFRHADPSVKRKSGFLMPSYGHSSRVGHSLEVPYFFALAPHYDFTFRPRFTEKKGVLWGGIWRHRTLNGRYFVDMHGIYEQDDATFFSSSGDGDFRGSVRTRGDFNINKHWDWGWDVTVESDETFRRFYDIDSIVRRDRVSELFLTGQRDRNYFDMRGYRFGGIVINESTDFEYQVHPVVDHNYIASNPVWGGELSFNTNLVSLTRDDGVDSHRLSSEMHWRRSMVDGLGQVYTPFFGARGDVYEFSNSSDPATGRLSANPVTGRPYDDGFSARGLGVAGGEYRYPFVSHSNIGTHVVEPIAQVVARPDLPDQGAIPNEDAQSLVFDDTLLFDINKFSGYDRVETGVRANYGARYTLHGHGGGYFQAVLGQSVHLAGDNPFPEDSGLSERRSDYVAGAYFQPNRYLSFIAQGRFSEDDLSLKRSDVTASGSYGPFSSSLTYASLDAQPTMGIDKDREEILFRGNMQLTNYWSMFGHMRYDLGREARVTDAVGLRYADDCFAISLSYHESFIRDRDIEPEQKVMLRFELKHLGTFDFQTDAPFGE